MGLRRLNMHTTSSMLHLVPIVSLVVLGYDASRSRFVYYVLGAGCSVVFGLVLLAWWLPDRLKVSGMSVTAILHAVLSTGFWKQYWDWPAWEYLGAYVGVMAWLGVAATHLWLKRHGEFIAEVAGVMHGTLTLAGMAGAWLWTHDHTIVLAIGLATAVTWSARTWLAYRRSQPPTQTAPPAAERRGRTASDDASTISTLSGNEDAGVKPVQRVSVAEYHVRHRTRESMRLLVHSPQFQAWMVDNSHRIALWPEDAAPVSAAS